MKAYKAVVTPTNRPETAPFSDRLLIGGVLRHESTPFATYCPPNGNELTAEGFRAWFRKCLLAKINRSDARPGRKLSAIYQLELYRDSQRLKGYGGFGKVLSTPEVRKRLGDHVHFYASGKAKLCPDRRTCEDRH